MLRRPQAEWNGRQLVDDGNGPAFLRHVDRLQIVTAGVAGFYADVAVLFGDVDGQLLDVFFAAGGTDDPPEFPLRGAERADQRTLAAVALRSQDSDLRPAGAERAERGRAVELRQ